MPDDRADTWVRDQLDVAREAFRRCPPGPGDSSLEQYEAQLRGRADAVLRPTASYVGLDLPAAQARAADGQDVLCVHRGERGHRANWRADRVHLELDAQGRVVAARRDPAPWEHLDGGRGSGT